MKKGLRTLCLAFLVLAFAACKKDNSNASNNTIAGVYQLTALKMQVNGAPEVDFYNQLTECMQRSTWHFQENGHFLFSGAVAANCSEDDYSGTWTLNDKTLTITAQQDVEAYQVLGFDGRTLSLGYTQSFNGMPATFYGRFTKQ